MDVNLHNRTHTKRCSGDACEASDMQNLKMLLVGAINNWLGLNSRNIVGCNTGLAGLVGELSLVVGEPSFKTLDLLSSLLDLGSLFG